MPYSHFHQHMTRVSRWEMALRFLNFSKHMKNKRFVWEKDFYFHKICLFIIPLSGCLMLLCCIILQVCSMNSRRTFLEPPCPHPPYIYLVDQITDRNSHLFMSQDHTKLLPGFASGPAPGFTGGRSDSQLASVTQSWVWGVLVWRSAGTCSRGKVGRSERERG